MHVIVKCMQAVSGRPTDGKCVISQAKLVCKCNDSRGVSCSAWQRSGYVSVVFGLFCRRLCSLMNKEMKYLWQATRTHTFVTVDNHKQGDTAHTCLQPHTQMHYCHEIAKIMHVDKSTTEEEQKCEHTYIFNWHHVQKTNMKTLYNRNCQDKFICQPLNFSTLIWPTNQPTHPQSSTKNFIFPPLLFFSTSCWDHVWGQDPRCPHPPPPPSSKTAASFGTVCQSGKSSPCSVRSAHIITQHSRSTPKNFHS